MNAVDDRGACIRIIQKLDSKIKSAYQLGLTKVWTWCTDLLIGCGTLVCRLSSLGLLERDSGAKA